MECKNFNFLLYGNTYYIGNIVRTYIQWNTLLWGYVWHSFKQTESALNNPSQNKIKTIQTEWQN